MKFSCTIIRAYALLMGQSLSVSVKVEPESAAGLVFGSDDNGDKQYGFYASSGFLRVTHFAGADVFSWKIIEQQKETNYRAGEWNKLKVRVEQTRFICFVDDVKIAEVPQPIYFGKSVGFILLRDSKAEFQAFQLQE